MNAVAQLIALILFIAFPCLPTTLADEAEAFQKCEERLKALGEAIKKYAKFEGGGKKYPESLTDLVKAKLIGPKTGLRCPKESSPKQVGPCLIGYLSAFEIVDKQLTTSIPSVRPLVWDKPGNHEIANLALLADGRVVRFADESEFRKFVGGWENRRYLQKFGVQRKSTDALLRMLREQSEDINVYEVQAVLAERGPDILPKAFKELAWGIPAQRTMLREIVKRMGPAAEEVMLKELNSSDRLMRERALELLAVMGSKAANERFIKLMDSRYESAQLMGIEGLVILKAVEAIPSLTRLVKSEAPVESRRAAVDALRKLAGLEARPILHEALKDEEIDVRIAAVKALARLKDTSVTGPLRAIHRQANLEQRKELLAAYAALGSKEALRSLQSLLQIQSKEKVFAALKTIREEKVTQLLKYVLPLLGKGPYEIRMEAARTLGDLGTRAALAPLREQLKSKNIEFARVVQAVVDKLEENGLMGEESSLLPGSSAIVMTDGAPLYNNKRVILKIPEGHTCTVSKSQGNWTWIQTLHQRKSFNGWIEGKHLASNQTDLQLPFVTRIVSEAGKVMNGSSQLVTLPKGHQVVLLRQNAGWFLLQTIFGEKRVNGWITANAFAKPQPLQKDLDLQPFKMQTPLGLPRFNDTGISTMSLSPSGERLAVIIGGRLEIWDLITNKKLKKLKGKRPFFAVAFNKTSHNLVVANATEIKEYDIDKNMAVLETYMWQDKGLSAADVFTSQGRSAFPYNKKLKILTNNKQVKTSTSWVVKVVTYQQVGMNSAEATAMARRMGIEQSEDDGINQGELRPLGGSKKKGAVPDPQKPPNREAGGPPKRKPGEGGEGIDIEEEAEEEKAQKMVGYPLQEGVIRLDEPKRPILSAVSSQNGYYMAVARPSKVDILELFTLRAMGSIETGSRGRKVLAFSPSIRFIATGGEDGLVRIWETLSRRLRRIIKPKGGKILALALAPDDQTMAVSSLVSGLQIWDFQNRKLIQKLDYQGFINTMQFTPDNKTLLIGNADSTVSIYQR